MADVLKEIEVNSPNLEVLYQGGGILFTDDEEVYIITSYKDTGEADIVRYKIKFKDNDPLAIDETKSEFIVRCKKRDLCIQHIPSLQPEVTYQKGVVLDVISGEKGDRFQLSAVVVTKENRSGETCYVFLTSDPIKSPCYIICPDVTKIECKEIEKCCLSSCQRLCVKYSSTPSRVHDKLNSTIKLMDMLRSRKEMSDSNMEKPVIPPRDRQLCSICLSEFNKPKILECSHTFCFICLEDYINRTSDNNLFPCPLCRREITVPEGGVEEFTSNVDVVQTSEDDMEKTAIPPCEVCERDVKSEFKCEDCEQYLCSSCRTMHDSLKGCKDHVVVEVKKVTETAREDNSDYTDICIHHPRRKARCYCKDCLQAVCSDCFTKDHRGHSYLDLRNDVVRKRARADLEQLNWNLETEMTRHENYLDSLRSVITDINTSSVVACDNVDKQVDKICCRMKKLGEDIKKDIEENRVNEEEKLTKLVKAGETLIEDLKASIKCTGNILEEKLMVEVIERKVKVEKEKEASKERKLDIPDVNYPWFEEREIDVQRLLEQLGKLEIQLQSTFTTSFNFDDVKLQSGEHYNKDEYSIRGLSWCISVRKATGDNKDTLNIFICLISTMKSCDVKYSLKLINYKDSSQSVERHGDHLTFPDNGGAWGWRFIDWSRFSNKQNGFLTDDNAFTVQATVKVLKIEHD